MKFNLLILALAASTAITAPAAAQTGTDLRRWEQAQRRYENETALYERERARFDRLRARSGRPYGYSTPGYGAPGYGAPGYGTQGYPGSAPGYGAPGYPGSARPYDERFATDYDAADYYREDSRYQERRLTAQDQVYRGSDGRYYCKRSDGTTGLIIGGAGGALLGNLIDGGGNRIAGTLIGGALGAITGRAIDQNSDIRCR